MVALKGGGWMTVKGGQEAQRNNWMLVTRR
jgi:hypothetical protein